jgi:hypothetical protein
MANRFWVGGTASWDATAGTKWALTSGGAGGQAVPTSSDDVFFDGTSGAVTITLGSIQNAKTFANSAALIVAGNITLASGMTLTGVGGYQPSGTCLFTTAGKTIASLDTFYAPTITMVDALNVSGSILAYSNATLILKDGVTSTAGSVSDQTTAVGLFALGSTAPATATISVASGNVSIRYAMITYSTATGGATFTAGPGATDNGNNVGWTFLSGLGLFQLESF